MGEKTKFYVDVSSLHKEVTGSCILNTVRFPDGSKKMILVDCGMFQEKDYVELNKSFPFIPSNIDHLIITHNHMDHIGRIPFLVKKGYQGKIHMTKATQVLIKPALYDGVKVFQSRYDSFNEPMLYTTDDVDSTIKLIEGHEYEKGIFLDTEERIKLTFFMNGHLPGAAIVLLQLYYPGYKKINLLFTGDYSSKNSFFDVNSLPKEICDDEPITVICESTYGDMNSSEIKEVFVNNIKEAVDAKKQIVCPVFSLGRTQEVMLKIKQMQDEGLISKSVPIYYQGPLGCKYNLLYESTENVLGLNENARNFYPANLTIVTNKQKEHSIIAKNDCKIVLCSSGMGTYGPSRTYLPAFLSKSNALIHFTGYLSEDSMGRAIYEAEPGSVCQLLGQEVKKRAQVEYTSEFSSHAKADELITFLKRFKHLKCVLINHGEESTKHEFSKRVVNEIEPKFTAVLGEYLYRIGPYGFANKSYNTKYQPVK
ncbi:MAG: MBL fold metallo-hydrolase [Clostridia bacterium]|nr:MBL fold metallo-hydrolase [Clostridia bacterium]